MKEAPLFLNNSSLVTFTELLIKRLWLSHMSYNDAKRLVVQISRQLPHTFIQKRVCETDVVYLHLKAAPNEYFSKRVFTQMILQLSS